MPFCLYSDVDERRKGQGDPSLRIYDECGGPWSATC